MDFNIAKCGHTELYVTDLDRSHDFYVNLLGFVLTERTDHCLYLRALEEREHHSLVLRQADVPRVSHLAFKVGSDTDLDVLGSLFERQGRPVKHISVGDPENHGHGRSIRVQDPSGLPLEFYAHMNSAERMLQRFDQYRGAQPLRLDHFNCQVPDVDVAYAWYTQHLKFRLSEYTETDDGRLWAAWLFRKQTVHDLALMNGLGPRLHHVAFWFESALNLIRACDILASTGWAHSIERGPGRHGLSNALFLYLRDPDGHRLEFYASDYLTADPELEPIRWSIHDVRRQTFWGHKAPDCWFDEATLVEDIFTGKCIEPKPGQLVDRPQFAT